MASSPPAPPPAMPGPVAEDVLTLDRFVSLVRSPKNSLAAYLGEISGGVTVDATKATIHSRHLLHDGSGRPRVKDLAERLVHEIVDYSIPRPQIQEASRKFAEDNSVRHFAKLHEKAKKLFTDIENSGEGGELLLYLLTECYLQLPQLLCKMPLKTSSHMHFHGSDGIHGTVDEATGHLALYWGESKLYATPSEAIGACFESLKSFVLTEGGSAAPQRRDLELLADNLKLDDEALEEAILRFLDPDDPLFNQLEYRGVALVGFDSEKYPTDGSPCVQAEVLEELRAAVKSWNKSTAHYVTKHGLADIQIELFCLPFPSVQAFRDSFLSELGLK